MQGAEERRLRRMSNTPQGGAIEGNAADDALMVDQGILESASGAPFSCHDRSTQKSKQTLLYQFRPLTDGRSHGYLS